MATRTTTMQWLFFVGPDGVVHSTRGRNQATTDAAFASYGLTSRSSR